MAKAKWTSVTKTNFAATLPQVCTDIREADFVTFDTELTGLQLTRAHRNGSLDDLPLRYGKLRDSVSNFGLLQVGLACFKWNEKRSKYSISAYSFYVFPSAANGLQQERKFTCQLGSLTFLSEYKFDFNKAFHEGIPFITKKEESIIKSNSVYYRENGGNNSGNSNNNGGSTDKPLVLLKDEERSLVEDVCDQINVWLQQHQNYKLLSSKNEDLSTATATSTVTKTSAPSNIFELPPLNSYQRLIFYQQIPLKYGDKLIITKKLNNLVLRFVGDEETSSDAKSAALLEEKGQFERSLEEQVGFRRVVDCLIEEKKPIVGHNCWVDLLHFYHKFIDQNLPVNYEMFKEEILKHFPVIVDTKYLARNHSSSLAQIKETSLSDLTNLTTKYPENSYFKKNGPGEESDNLFHDAGFDAICTGRVFLTLTANFVKPEIIERTLTGTTTENNNVKGLVDFIVTNQHSGFCNRLNILQSDYKFFDLLARESEPERANVLYIYGLPANCPTNSLQSSLQSLIQGGFHCQLHWLNESTCFLQCELEEMTTEILNCFEKSTQWATFAPLAKIISYGQYQEKKAAVSNCNNNNNNSNYNTEFTEFIESERKRQRR